MVKNKSKDLDQFYTHPDYASKFLDIVKKKTNYKNFDIILEPSAGTGSFYNLLDNRRIGLDLDPKYLGIIKTNFFDYNWTKLKNKKRWQEYNDNFKNRCQFIKEEIDKGNLNDYLDELELIKNRVSNNFLRNAKGFYNFFGDNLRYVCIMNNRYVLIIVCSILFSHL